MSAWQLIGDAPIAYDRFALKVMEPWTDDLILAGGCRDGDRVLDVACGTGLVAGRISLVSRKFCAITGIDINEGMLSVARRNPQIEWHQGSATELPFADGSFDVVLCQQGLHGRCRLGGTDGEPFFDCREALIRLPASEVEESELGGSTCVASGCGAPSSIASPSVTSRPSFNAASPLVPDPPNGSSTVQETTGASHLPGWRPAHVLRVQHDRAAERAAPSPPARCLLDAMIVREMIVLAVTRIAILGGHDWSATIGEVRCCIRFHGAHVGAAAML
jgi:Methyltransferase domain